MTKIITSASLVQLINKHGAEKVVGRAVMVLYMHQTDEEKSGEETITRNGVGFTGYDAKVGTITAQYYIEHGGLQPWMIKYWMKLTKAGYPKICRYAKQLDREAKAKQQLKEKLNA